MQKFEVCFGVLHLFVCFGDSICMEIVILVYREKMKLIADDCVGQRNAKAYLFSMIGTVYVRKERYVWM